MQSDKVLDSKLKAEIMSGDGKLVMAQLTDFKWDSLLILKPYSNPGRVEDELDLNLSMVKHTGIHYGDNSNILVYLYEGRVVNMVDFSRYPGDFSMNKIELIPKSLAVFEVKVTDQKNIDGNIWIEVVRVSK